MITKPLSFWSRPAGTVIQTILVLAALPAAWIILPYLYRVASHPWSWSLVRPSSLTGVWVGTLSDLDSPRSEAGPADAAGKKIFAEILARTGASGPAAHPARPRQIAILLKPHLQLFTWATRLAGSAETCDPSGRKTELSFSQGQFDQNQIRLMLVNRNNPTGGGGGVEGSVEGRAIAVVYRSWDGIFQGRLERQSQEDFANFCSALSQAQTR